MRQSALRLHSVRWKSGGELRLLAPHPDKRQEIIKRVTEILGAHDTAVSGFAFVAWSPDGGSTAIFSAGAAINTMQLPDFARERLMAEAVLAWARQDRE